MTVFLLFLYFAKANSMIVPDWMMTLTWVITVGSGLIKFFAELSKAKE